MSVWRTGLGLGFLAAAVAAIGQASSKPDELSQGEWIATGDEDPVVGGVAGLARNVAVDGLQKDVEFGFDSG